MAEKSGVSNKRDGMNYNYLFILKCKTLNTYFLMILQFPHMDGLRRGREPAALTGENAVGRGGSAVGGEMPRNRNPGKRPFSISFRSSSWSDIFLFLIISISIFVGPRHISSDRSLHTAIGGPSHAGGPSDAGGTGATTIIFKPEDVWTKDIIY